MKKFNEWLKKKNLELKENHFNQSNYIINGQVYNVPSLAKWAANRAAIR